MYSTVKSRAFNIVNLLQFECVNKPEYAVHKPKETIVDLSGERCYVLRMLIKELNGDFHIPEELSWVQPIIDEAIKGQKLRGIEQPFCYLTIRHGIVTTQTDNEWHVDGFSMNVTHIPEQNYVWCASDKPTEYVEKGFDIPIEFDPKKHNIHKLIHRQISEDSDVEIKSIPNKQVVAMDPYVPHRRPESTQGEMRCFVRVSFTPIEINDVNNTQNPLIPRNYTRDGVEIRNQLVDFYEN